MSTAQKRRTNNLGKKPEVRPAIWAYLATQEGREVDAWDVCNAVGCSEGYARKILRLCKGMPEDAIVYFRQRPTMMWRYFKTEAAAEVWDAAQ